MPEPDDTMHIIEPLCAVFRRKLRSEGLKYTPERARILDAVMGMDGPFQADQLIAALRAMSPASSGLRISKATVYRTIKLLADAGILQQVLFDAEHTHYQLAYGRGAVGVLIRTDTGHVEQVDIPELDAIVARICESRGLTVQGHRLVMYTAARS